MASPWKGVLAGLAGGGRSLVNTLETREMMEKAAQRQQAEDALKSLLTNAQVGRINAETQSLLTPKPTPQPTPQRVWVPDRGGIVDEIDGTFTPVLGLPAAPTKAPTLGTPEYLRAREDELKLEQRYRPPPAEPQPTIIQGVNEDGTPGVFRVPRGEGPATPVPGISPNTQGGQGSQAMKTKVAANRAMAAQIQAAINDVTSNPKAFGLRRMLGDGVNQRVDPGGVGPRAKVANLGSQKIHDRSGAAVSIHEAPRLQPFIPAVTDDSRAIIQKLGDMLKALEQETAELERMGGPAMSPGGGAPGYEEWKRSKAGTP